MTPAANVLAPEAATQDRPAHQTRLAPRVLPGSRVGLVLTGWTLAVYLVTALIVHQYYTERLPHYDSIGSYGRLFELVNQVHQEGFGAAVRSASYNSPTWLQPAYALLLAWAPIKAPEWLVGLNFVLLLGAQAAIVTYCRTFSFGTSRTIVAALLPVAPGAMYAWDGGIGDLRRDAQLVILLIGCFFASLAYVAAPSWQRGLAVGLLFGLTQWSRDNAAAMMTIVALPGVVFAAIRCRRQGGVLGFLRLGIVPLVVCVAVVAPYFLKTFAMTLERYSTNIWGVGEDRLESLLAFWNLPLSVLLGGDPRLGGRDGVVVITAAGLILAAGAILVLSRVRVGLLRLAPSRLREEPYALLLAGGVWVIVAVVLYNTVLLGYGPLGYGAPFLPIAVGLVAVCLGLTGLVRAGPRLTRRSALMIVGLICALLTVSVPARLLLSEAPPPPPTTVQDVQAASLDISERTRGRPVAFLWSAGFGRHHVRYYVAQAGDPPIVEFEGIAGANNDPIDLDQPLRPTDQPKKLQERLDRTLRRYADFVLVCTQTGFYADRGSILWPYKIGRPVVDGLLADPGWQPVAQYTLVGKPFVLLENHTRRP